MKKIILFVLLIVILVAGFCTWKIFGPVAKQPEGKFFYVRTGSTYADVKKNLVDKEIINGSGWFDFVSARLNYKTIRPGKYEIKSGMSLFNLVRMLKNGRQTPVDLVITKFRTKEDFARKIGREFETDSLQVINFLNNNDSLKNYSLDSNTWTCAVIPDTYIFFWNTTPSKIFSKLHEASEKYWTNEKKHQASNIGLDPCRVYTLASIIEEETNVKEDREKIASVYLNRLKKGMPLQADPTIKFAMKDFGLKRIYEKYLSFSSPYNTYINKGLPPGPICTPSPETIEAVLFAPATDYLYFVANSDLKGGSVFTSNYEEHMKFAKLYQQALNQQDSIRESRQNNK